MTAALLVGCRGTGPVRSSDDNKEAVRDSIESLASQSQEIRDAAAKFLRNRYRTPSGTNWTALVNKMTAGMPKTNVLEMLRPFKVTFEAGGASGRTHNEVYRLDDAWLLRFGYHNGKNRFQDGTLIHAELIESPRHVWVTPPTNFSGVWITYFVNGQKADETAFTDGNRGVLDRK